MSGYCRSTVGMAAGLLSLVLICAGPAVVAQERPQTHLLVITGVGGEDYYGDLFHRWAATLTQVATEHLGFAREHVVYLGERMDRAPGVIAGVSDKATVLAAVERIAARSRPGDRVMIVLIGHGTARGDRVLFNVPGPDLSAKELADALGRLSDRTLAVVNTTPSSGAFVQYLSAPNRVVIAATSGGAENQHTLFAAHFVDAFAEPGADADKDERVSLLEAFDYARREVDRAYRLDHRLLSEHAQLDDNGDGIGSREPGAAAADGSLAGRFYLAAADTGDPSTAQGRASLALQVEARRLVDRIEGLKRRKLGLAQSDYETRLEALLVELAINRRAHRQGRLP